jgi:hypothetical protein
MEGHLGPACDSILECKVVLASGEVVTVSNSQHSDLFWALRGAGRYFGIVLECTVKIHTFSLINRSDGHVWSATTAFDPAQAEAVFSAYSNLIQRNDPNATGLLIMGCPPPAFEPALMTALCYFGSASNAETVYSEILAIPNLFNQVAEVPFANINDGADMYCDSSYRHKGDVGQLQRV